MAKNIELLLTESVENLGIVGDVVKVRIGYARNFLLPRAFATVPSEELIQQLQAKRALAQKEMAALREQRRGIINKLTGYELGLVRTCNDLGVLYGAVTQQEISSALVGAGFAVRPRDVRLSETIKRVGDYEVHIKYESELETNIKLHVKADRELAKEDKAEMDFDDEGNLITAENPGKFRKPRKGKGADAVDAGSAIDAALSGDKKKSEGKSEAKGEPKGEGKKGEGKKGEASSEAEPKKASKKKKAE